MFSLKQKRAFSLYLAPINKQIAFCLSGLAMAKWTCSVTCLLWHIICITGGSVNGYLRGMTTPLASLINLPWSKWQSSSWWFHCWAQQWKRKERESSEQGQYCWRLC